MFKEFKIIDKMVKQRKKSKRIKRHRSKHIRKKRPKQVKKTKKKSQRGGLSAKNKQVVSQSVSTIVSNLRKPENQHKIKELKNTLSILTHKPKNKKSILKSLLFPL